MGFAILWVMLFHAKLQVNNPIIDFVFNIGYGGVDIFLFLSGFGLYCSCSHKWIGIKSFYIKRFQRIFPTFWVALILMYLMQGPYTLKGFFVLCAKCTTIGLWLPFVPMCLWYVSLICFLYIIYPLFFKSYMHKPHTTTLGVLAVSFLLMAIYIIINIDSERNGMLILALSRFPIFFIGSFFGKYLETSKISGGERNKAIILIMFTVVGLVLLWLFRRNYHTYLWNGALAFLPYIVIVPGLCYMIAIIMEMCPILAKPFSYIGSYTFEIYVLNEFLLACCYPLIATIFSYNLCKIAILVINIILGIVLFKFVNTITILLKKSYDTIHQPK